MRLPHPRLLALIALLGAGLPAGTISSPAHALQAPPVRNGARNLTPAQREAHFFAQVEKGLGKKLTPMQKQQLRQAFKERAAAHKAVETKFRGRAGKILGLTPAQLRAKARQMGAGR